jgi:hypothetical protein
VSKEDYEEVEIDPGVELAVNNEFNRLQRRLRRQAGYDLTWWERLVLRAARAFRIDFRFK